jgi:hypothetical protein
VKGHREMRAYVRYPLVKGIAIKAPKATESVHSTPTHQSATACRLEFGRQRTRRRCIGRRSGPSLANAIDIPGQPRDEAFAARRHGQFPTLREWGGLQSESVPAEIASLPLGVGSSTPKAHCLNESVESHSDTIVENFNERIAIAPIKVNADLSRTSGERIVNQISQRCLRGIAKTP